MRYMLFAFNEYEASGGMDDYVKAADSVEELRAIIRVGLPYPNSKPAFDVGRIYMHREGTSPVWFDTVQIVDYGYSQANNNRP